MRRGQEYEADGYAEHIVGTAELGATLRRTGAIGRAWQDFQARFLAPMHAAGCTPDDVFDAFARMLAADDYQEVLKSFEQEQVRKKTEPSDTHPCLADRLARLRDGDPVPPPWAGGAPGRRPAAALIPVLPDRPWSATLSDTVKPHGAIASLPWDDCVRRVAQGRSLALASDLLAALRAVGAAHLGRGSGGAGGLTLTDVLLTISNRRGDVADAFAARSAAPGGSRDPLARLSAGLFALIGYLLVSSERARWVVSWSGGLAPAAQTLDTWDVTDTATRQLGARVSSFVTEPDAGHESAITGHLRSLGLNPDQPVDVAAAAPARSVAGRPAGRPGGTVVILPAGNMRDAVKKRRTTMIAVGSVAGVVIAVSAIVTAARTPGSPAPLSQVAPLSTLPADPVYTPPTRGLVLPSPVIALPTGYLKIPAALLPLPGATGRCPAPLGPGATCIAIVVQRGDTLSLLACRYGTTVPVLQEINGLGTSTAIDAGATIIVPERAGGPAACG